MPATVAISSKRKNQCVIVKCAHIQTCLGFTMCPLHTKPLCCTVCSASKSKSGQKKLGFTNSKPEFSRIFHNLTEVLFQMYFSNNWETLECTSVERNWALQNPQAQYIYMHEKAKGANEAPAHAHGRKTQSQTHKRRCTAYTWRPNFFIPCSVIYTELN